MSDDRRIFFIVYSDYRTGSTLVFNMIKEIVRYNYPEKEVTFRGGCLDKIDFFYQTTDNYVLKTHRDILGIPQREDQYIVYVNRNPLDKISSSLLRGFSYGNLTPKDLPHTGIQFDEESFWEGQLEKMEQTATEMKYFHERQDAMIVEYEELFYNTRKIMYDLAKFLKLPVTEDIIEKTIKKYSTESVKKITNHMAHENMDTDTQFRGNHVSLMNGIPGQWMIALPDHAILKIVKKYRELFFKE